MINRNLPFPKSQREFYQMFRTDEDCIEYMFQTRRNAPKNQMISGVPGTWSRHSAGRNQD